MSISDSAVSATSPTRATRRRFLVRAAAVVGTPALFGLLQAWDQERKILDLIAEGYTNRQIAETIFLAEKTVKNYVSNLLAKLGMSRRTEAAAYAARLTERRKQEPH